MGIWSSFAVAAACVSFLHVGRSDSGFSLRYPTASTYNTDDYTNYTTYNVTGAHTTNPSTASDVESRNSMQFGEFPLSKISNTRGRHSSRFTIPQTTLEDDRATRRPVKLHL